MKNILIFGASGAIGAALTQHAASEYPEATITAVSRRALDSTPPNVRMMHADYTDEAVLADAVQTATRHVPLDRVVVAIGLLHGQHEQNGAARDGADRVLMPEKSLRELSPTHFADILAVNTIAPAIIAKHCLPHLNREPSAENGAVFAALSARVGSISDNRLGGWYAYRASKAALNMIIKTAAIETARANKCAIIVGLHPGTVASALSAPFQSRVPEGKLFTPEYAARHLWQVLDGLSAADSGKCFAWDGAEIAP